MGVDPMEKKEIILSALAAGNRDIHTPVQIQKLLFLIDKNVAQLIEGPFFNFQPYAYGPFDKQICELLELLNQEGDIEAIRNPYLKWVKYRLTPQGQRKGEAILSLINKEAKTYIVKLSEFVRSLKFTELVSAIYKAYPEMKINSVFQD